MVRLIVFVLSLCLCYSAVQCQETPSGCEAHLEARLAYSKSDTTRINLLVKISKCHFWSPSRTAVDLETAHVHASAAKKLSEELNYTKGLGDSYELLAMISHTRGDTINGRRLARRAVEIFEANGFHAELGYAYFDLAGYYSLYGSDLSKRIALVEKSLAAFRRSGSKKKIADILKELADVRNLQQDYQRALTELKEALKLYDSLQYPRLQGTYDLMGFVLTKLGDFEQALKYGLLAVRTAERVNDTTLQLATIYNRVGIIYLHLRQPDRALKYFQQGFLIGTKFNDTQSVLLLAANISNCLLLLHRPEESLALLETVCKKYKPDQIILKINIASRLLSTYRALKQYQNAQRYCDTLLNLNAKYDPKGYYQHVIYEGVIAFFTETKQVGLARKYLALSDELATTNHTPDLQSKNHLYWFKLDSIEGHYQSAISHYQQYKVLEDSLLNEAKGKKIEQLQIEFETEKKDQQIQLLGNRNQLQQAQLERSEFAKRVTYAGIGLLSIIVGLMIYHSRHRQQSHKILVKQQGEIKLQNASLQSLVKEKDWLIKEIHHRVKNNFHIVIGLLGTQSQYLKNSEAVQAMAESQHRIHAMSLIHQKLYQSENFSAINMPDYIYELVDYLKTSFETHTRIQFDLQIERVELDLFHSLPIGLILNESITNSIKYAFPGGRQGKITISLHHNSETDLVLIITDDGIGMPLDFDSDRSKSMGVNLMKGLSEDIGGTFSIQKTNGTQIHIGFNYDLDNAGDFISTKPNLSGTV